MAADNTNMVKRSVVAKEVALLVFMVRAEITTPIDANKTSKMNNAIIR